MSDNKRTGYGMFGKGYYIALILCAAAIGITGYLYYRNADETNELQNTVAEATVPAEQSQNVEAIATQPQIQSPVTPESQATQPAMPRALQTTSPVAGEQVYGYAMEVLSYNQTTRDWRTHNGIDIAAEAGTEVVAAADGQVYTTYEDETLGYTVVIRHEGGYTTRYSSLSQELAVSAGDAVTMGQVIGTVDSSALVETALGPHVHFSVTYQDLPMDPAEFLSLG